MRTLCEDTLYGDTHCEGQYFMRTHSVRAHFMRRYFMKTHFMRDSTSARVEGSPTGLEGMHTLYRAVQSMHK